MFQRVKRLLWHTSLLLCLLSGAVTAHTDGPEAGPGGGDFDKDQQAVVSVLEAYAAAYAATDLDAIRRLTVDDGRFTYFEGASADWSWEAFAEHAGAEMPSFSEAYYAFSNFRPEVGASIAFATFDWEMNVVVLSEQFAGGRHPVSMQGIGTAILVREHGDWKLRHLQTARGESRQSPE